MADRPKVNLAPNALITKLAPVDDAHVKTLTAQEVGKGLTKAANDAVDELATALGKVPELVRFDGYVGAIIDDTNGSTGETWLQLFVEASLMTWLLIKASDIYYRDSVEVEDGLKDEKRDVLLVRALGAVSVGGRPRPPTAQLLEGPFTSAASYAASIRGPEMSAATGPYCGTACGRHTS